MTRLKNSLPLSILVASDRPLVLASCSRMHTSWFPPSDRSETLAKASWVASSTTVRLLSCALQPFGQPRSLWTTPGWLPLGTPRSTCRSKGFSCVYIFFNGNFSPFVWDVAIRAGIRHTVSIPPPTGILPQPFVVIVCVKHPMLSISLIFIAPILFHFHFH